MKEGTSAIFLQAGLDEKWWADAMECNCFLRNAQDFLSEGKTPFERRYGEPLCEPITPSGLMIEYHSMSAKDQTRLHQFGTKIFPEIFIGYALRAENWKGDILIADIQELKILEASEIHARTLNGKEVIVPKIGETF